MDEKVPVVPSKINAVGAKFWTQCNAHIDFLLIFPPRHHRGRHGGRDAHTSYDEEQRVYQWNVITFVAVRARVKGL